MTTKDINVSIKGLKSLQNLPKKQPTLQIVYFDIETTLAQFYGFRLGEQSVGWEQIKKEPVVCVICWAVNDGKVQSAVFDMSKYNPNAYDDESDLKLISDFVKIANSADLLVAHNSPFDLGVLGNRIMKHRLPAIAPVLVDDTYFKTKIKKTMSHKLDYLLHYFGIGSKVKHRGLDMWKDVASKNVKALQEMKTYCIGDVEGLRNLYKYVKPYIKSSLSMAVFYGKPDVCPKCGLHGSLIARGYAYTATSKRQKYNCNNAVCNWWGTDGINLLSKKVTGVPTKNFKR